jgi:hypothetical protein
MLKYHSFSYHKCNSITTNYIENKITSSKIICLFRYLNSSLVVCQEGWFRVWCPFYVKNYFSSVHLGRLVQWKVAWLACSKVVIIFDGGWVFRNHSCPGPSNLGDLSLISFFKGHLVKIEANYFLHRSK